MTVRPTPVTLLILGKGWTSDFLIPLLKNSNISFAATTRDGRDNTIPFTFDPDDSKGSDLAQYKRLPDARVVLVTFPLPGALAPKVLLQHYESTRHAATTTTTTTTTTAAEKARPAYVLLGSTSIWTHEGVVRPSDPPAYRAPRSGGPGGGGPTFPSDNPRARAEDSLLEMRPDGSVVLCLCGLYGGSREPRKWAGRVAQSKEDVSRKKGVQFVHGKDVARGIRGVVQAVQATETAEGTQREAGCWDELKGKRWIVTDLRYYDWWDMLLTWDESESIDVEDGERKLPYARWVGELMAEEHVPALPRSADKLGKVLDGTEFWQKLGIYPSMGRMT